MNIKAGGKDIIISDVISGKVLSKATGHNKSITALNYDGESLFYSGSMCMANRLYCTKASNIYHQPW